MKGLSIVESLINNFLPLDLFNKNKEGQDEPDIAISLVYLSNKWWEV